MKNQIRILPGLVAIMLASCSEYLDMKPDKKLTEPSSLDVLQGIMDYYPDINRRDAGAGEASADNYYLEDAAWASRDEFLRRMYIWEENIFSGLHDWRRIYGTVYAANTVLDNLKGLDVGRRELNRWKDIKGQALFIRGKAFLEIASLWSVAYDEHTAPADLGIPLRLEADFNIVSKRSSVAETYERILKDLHEAASLLPDNAVHVKRACKAAAFGLLSRTYLYMGRFGEAELYADSCLLINSRLMDFNNLDPHQNNPIPAYNEEIIFQSSMAFPNILAPNRARIDTSLYRTYHGNDLRKALFFRQNSNGSYAFRGSYGFEYFSGVATDELYLTRAECRARREDNTGALEDLNLLLQHRFARGTLQPLTPESVGNVLETILKERRKELLMRGIRWMDIKRLNKLGAGIRLTRNIDGQRYELLPNDPRYALPIPQEVLETTNLPQNPR